MPASIIDKLLTDIVAITERLMESEPVDLAALQTGPTALERRGIGKEKRPHRKRVTKTKKTAQPVPHPMATGIHRAVC